jgi:hypothetical protein
MDGKVKAGNGRVKEGNGRKEGDGRVKRRKNTKEVTELVYHVRNKGRQENRLGESQERGKMLKDRKVEGGNEGRKYMKEGSMGWK